MDWLCEQEDWGALAGTVKHLESQAALARLQILANSRMDFVRAMRLDSLLQRCRQHKEFESLLPRVRVGLIGSSTLSHLIAGMRLGALRRGLLLDVYEGVYGMYRQELMDPGSGLHSFRPDVVLISLDAHHAAEPAEATPESILEMLRSSWRLAQNSVGSAVIQQTFLPVLAPVIGNQEAQYASSPYAKIARVNSLLREDAPAAGVHLLTVDALAADQGLTTWFDPGLWYRAKQEVHPRVSGLYGDHVGRILGALRGKSAKCLVLDLDNTLWGGVVGDDGVDGVVIGEGSEVGEAFLALQHYAKSLSERGVILAVCSKNDEAMAVLPFAQRPEMILKRSDISCFVANWEDKAGNLRRIAEKLNIGLDSLVFVDDNPFERNLVRRELPMVSVPELPEDPAGFVKCLAAAGYFETVGVTNDDKERSRQYSANQSREQLRETATDLQGFLAALKMKLTWSSFQEKDLKRVVQLINKTNQFNLTTRRCSEEAVRALLLDKDVLTLQARLLDVYGNNGIIALVIGRRVKGDTLALDTWLMSCRVLGRCVEQATLNIIKQQAEALGCRRITGRYCPTASNGMVRSHYEKLGFMLTHTAADGTTDWACALSDLHPIPTEIETVEEGEHGVERDLQAAD